MKRKLNATEVKQAKTSGEPRKLADGGGLYLEVKSKDKCFWRYRYRIQGKENVFALGASSGENSVNSAYTRQLEKLPGIP